jgi:hypothetical protein
VTFTEALTASPLLYPIGLDGPTDAVSLVRMTAADYDGASFLDARMLPPGCPVARMSWDEVREAAAGLPERCHLIFHISHVGSTLLSRLLGQHPAFFSLREPAILRQLADAWLVLGQPDCPWSRPEFEKRLGVFLALWSRTFDRGQTAVIKATSFVSEMSEHLMDRVATARSIFMYVTPLTFLKALLGGAMSDIASASEKRLIRLERRLGGPHWRGSDLSAGECVAMSWVSEMAALRAAGDRFPDRVLWIDFDRFLVAPEAGLGSALRHFGADEGAATSILAGPTMRQYAKAPAYGFDAGRRRLLLEQAEQLHADEVRRGMDWLARAAEIPALQSVFGASAFPTI